METSNTSNGASVWIGIPSTERHLVFVLLAVVGIAILTSFVAVFVDVNKDGYRRIPERQFVRIY